MNNKFNLPVFAVVMLIALFFWACSGMSSGSNYTPSPSVDYRQQMRDFVQSISSYARGLSSGFVIIPQNGNDLITADGESSGTLETVYLAAIDGMGREDLFYGYDNDNTATPAAETTQMVAFLDVAESNGVQVMVTDYCSTRSYVDNSYQQNNSKGYISFAADKRDLNNIPAYPATPYAVNTSNVSTLAGAKNFLYLLDTNSYSSKSAFVAAVAETNYDLIITDLYFQGSEILTASDVTALKTKKNGGSRLVIAYMSIGEAENYRYYWESSWTTSPPSWLKAENSDWPGNYKVEYWNTDWQAIIYGNDSSYTRKILDAGFDGAYLDIIDAYEFFEGS